MDEFEIEKNNTKIKIRLNSPNRKDAREYRKQATELHNFSKTVEEGNVEGQIKIQDMLDQMMLGMVIKLNNNEVFKSLTDFDDVNNSDLNKLYGWVQAKMKVSFDEGFLHKSQ